jgi:hypothetical protein
MSFDARLHQNYTEPYARLSHLYIILHVAIAAAPFDHDRIQTFLAFSKTALLRRSRGKKGLDMAAGDWPLANLSIFTQELIPLR